MSSIVKKANIKFFTCSMNTWGHDGKIANS